VFLLKEELDRLIWECGAREGGKQALARRDE
jgi:hypothetical protein